MSDSRNTKASRRRRAPGPAGITRNGGNWRSLLECARFAPICLAAVLHAGVGDPQIKTDHPFYPGELACSTFERLFATEAEQYRRATGIFPETDQDKALAAWFWRNTHYFHGEEGAENLWGREFLEGGDSRTREYWTGLFAHGFGLCGTTHSQWTAELENLLGHGRARGVGVDGHNAFEVFLDGRWALLDHDLSTVVFDTDGKRLLSIAEIRADLKKWIDRGYEPQKQNGWLVCGLHPNDGTVYSDYSTAEYFPGYAAVPPIVHLRRGETLRRYLEPGLEDGKTFVFWGRNYNSGGIPGPERSITWVNQPEKMRGSQNGAGYQPGQARYGNAEYRYKPNFENGDYREGVINESNTSITFEFYTPYIIGATPPNNKDWGIYDSGGRNGLVLRGNANCQVEISVDQGGTWQNCGAFMDRMDLTDHVKGYRQYWIRLGAGADSLKDSDLTMTTVCQAAIGVLPRLKDHGAKVSFEASHTAVVSAGPTLPQAKAHVVSGGFNTPEVALKIASPSRREAVMLYASAHVASGNPPSPDVAFQIEYSADDGRTWKPIVKDWKIPRRGDEPPDFWSQSLCYGSIPLTGIAAPIQVRFRNNGGRNYLRAEAHLVYRVPAQDSTAITFAWTDSAGEHRDSHVAGPIQPAAWTIATAEAVKTKWVEFSIAK